MKKIYLVITVVMLLEHSSFAQVGIGTTTPQSSAMLDVTSTTKGLLIPRMTSTQRVAIASPVTGLMVYDTDNSSFWLYNGATLGWVQVNYWTNTSLNSSDVYNTNTGNVGIGTTTPVTKLTIKTLSNSYGVTQTDGTVTVGSYIGASTGWIGTRSNHPLSFFTNDGGQAMTLATNGNFGIGITNPVNKLQIGSMGAIGFNGNDIAFGNGTNATGFAQTNSFLQVASSTNITLLPANGAGNVGVNTSSPANTFQIGSVGATGYTSNNFAFGNGTNATGFSQTNSFLQVASSTDIALMPRTNGHGRVGINTTTPRAPLDVVDNVGIGSSTVGNIPGWAYLTVAVSNASPVDVEGATDGSSTSYTVPNVSIIASNRILATEFDAYSDARIKNITGFSEIKNDLKTLEAIRVTDYTMKDKVKYGDKPFKKVIAQQVEEVYPQVVSKHTDFIPNVYQLANKVDKVTNGYLLHFEKKHNITVTAKRLQVLLPGKDAMQQFDIASIPNDHDVVIVQPAPAGEVSGLSIDKIFVYGEEVNDFRTVDYEGLTTLNISATQELSKLVSDLNKKIDAMQREIKYLKAKAH